MTAGDLLACDTVSERLESDPGAEAPAQHAIDAIEVLCTRRLDPRAFPLVQVEAIYVKSRSDGRAVYESVVAATGFDADGGAEALGVSVGDSEQVAFWAEFLISLRVRGLHGVELLLADEHGGLVDALAAVYPDAAWQRVGPGPVLVVDDQPFSGANRVVLEWRDSQAGDPAASAVRQREGAERADGPREPRVRPSGDPTESEEAL